MITNLPILVIVRFQQLFNILYDERIDCKLEKTALLEQRMLNWNKINGKPIELPLSGPILTWSHYIAQICFNYLQQQFYLVKPSMKALASGKKEDVTLKLIKNLINTV